MSDCGIHASFQRTRVKRVQSSTLTLSPLMSPLDAGRYIDWLNIIAGMFGLVWFRGLTPQQQPGSYQGGEMMMKSVFWWRKPEHPEETTDLRQVTDETFSHIRPLSSPGIELGPQRCEAK